MDEVRAELKLWSNSSMIATATLNRKANRIGREKYLKAFHARNARTEYSAKCANLRIRAWINLIVSAGAFGSSHLRNGPMNREVSSIAPSPVPRASTTAVQMKSGAYGQNVPRRVRELNIEINETLCESEIDLATKIKIKRT